jgi:predicted MFS family arabinose efflux permease
MNVRPAGPHPSLYALLILPFGALFGYLTVAVAYLLARAGMSSTQIGALIALFMLPQSWKFLWAPLIDATLTPARWYLLGTFASATSMMALALFAGAGFKALVVPTLIASMAVSFSGMSAEGLIAHSAPESHRGRAGGWLQAGNLGGMGLGGGLTLWLSQHVRAGWVPAAALAVCLLLCCLALRGLPRATASVSAQASRHELSARLLEVLRDVWQVLRTSRGSLALLLVFLPGGSAAASNLWSGIGSDWGASANLVALTNGALGGVVAALGCLVGGQLSDRGSRQAAYVVAGVLLALCAWIMSLAPHTPGAYLGFTQAYAFLSGVCYAAFSAVTLEAIGAGAAATKYNLFASLSNMPIAYMTAAEGWAHAHWGVTAMLELDAASALITLVLFGAAVLAVRAHSRARPDRSTQTA